MTASFGWLAKPALLVAGLLLVGWTLRSGFGPRALDAPAQLGPVWFVAVAALACAVGLPRQVVAYTAGAGFGLWVGLALALAAQVIGCLADFFWARTVARDWASRRIGRRLARLDTALRRHPFVTTLTLRLLPVGNNLVFNLLAGVSAVAAGPFLAASVLGYLPQTAVFVLLGAGVRVGQTAQIALGVALFVAAASLGVYLLQRTRMLDAG